MFLSGAVSIDIERLRGLISSGCYISEELAQLRSEVKEMEELNVKIRRLYGPKIRLQSIEEISV